MGAFLDKPKTDKHNEHGVGNGLRYGLASMQGWRIEMEDAHSAVANLPGMLKDWAFFAVFDGHAGAKISAHCSEHLLSSITSGEEFQPSSIAEFETESEEKTINKIKKGIHAGFLRLDESMRQMPEVASGEDKSGTTAVCALISPSHIFVANCGDSRGVLYRAGGIGFSTQDHKPVNPTEKERIQNAGGSVMIQRVNGSLAVSRALGDYEYKFTVNDKACQQNKDIVALFPVMAEDLIIYTIQNVEGKGPCEQLVSPEPEIYVERRQVDDEFLVLACDGIWDVMTNEDLCTFVRSRLLLSDDLESISNHVVDTCLHKGSRDNMSLVLITLPGAPKVSQEAIKREKELEDLIEKKVTEVCEQDGPVNMGQIMQTLDDEPLSNLPPGGGLISKRGFVDQIFRRLRPDCAKSESMDDVGDDGLGGNLVFLSSGSMEDKLTSILENSFMGDDDA